MSRPNAAFRDTMVELAKQAREDYSRASAELAKRSAKRRFTNFVRVGLVLIAMQIVLYLYLSNRRPTIAPTVVHKSRFADNTCNAVRYQAYWKIVAFLRDNGRPPASLDEMLGKYIDKLPMDPVTGKQLLYSTDGAERFELKCPGSTR
jgi:hypothetical protein